MQNAIQKILLGSLLATAALAQTRRLDVKTEILVSTDWLEAHLQDQDLVIVCVAEGENDYAAGHIPGARLLPLSRIVTTRGRIPNELPPVEELQRGFQAIGIDNSSRIVLYGDREGVLAARAYFTLDYLGLGNHAALLDGGIEKWRAEHRRETMEIPHIKEGNLRVHVHPDIIVDTNAMVSYARTPSGAVVLMDARPEAEFTGEQLSEDVSQPGHIPHSINLYWRHTLSSDPSPVLRPSDDLRRIFKAAGVLPGQEVITYCRTGMQSSFDYFVAKYLGYPVRMYDGSFFEWSRSSLPSETTSRNEPK